MSDLLTEELRQSRNSFATIAQALAEGLRHLYSNGAGHAVPCAGCQQAREALDWYDKMAVTPTNNNRYTGVTDPYVAPLPPGVSTTNSTTKPLNRITELMHKHEVP
jgi:hypothetical protein